MDKSLVDPDEIEKMKVLNLIEELQEDLNNHHIEYFQQQTYLEKAKNLHDKKLREMLYNIDKKDPIKFVTNFSSTELNHKIIEIYDLKPSGLIDT